MMHYPPRAPWWRLLFLLFPLAGLVLGADAKPSSRQLLQSSGTAPAAGPQPAPNSKAAPPNVAPSPSNLPSGLTTNAGLPYPFMPGLFVFGDSYVDTGNLKHLDKTPFPLGYGVYSENPFFGVTLRASNGPILSDYLSQALGLPALSPPFLEPNASWYYGCNFAVGGSGALIPNPGSLAQQTAEFVQFASDAARYWNSTPADPSTLNRFPKYPKPETFKDALFFIMVGANDCGFFDFTGLPDSQFSAWVSNVTGAIRSTMQTIYALGGRNFLLANVVNYGCIPESTASNGGNCSARETNQSAAFGASYQLLLDSFRADVADATLLLLDVWNASTPSASGRSRLGFREPLKACFGAGSVVGSTIVECADPGQHVFWDVIHFTSEFAARLAKEAFSGTTFVRPMNILQAFVLPKLQPAATASKES